MGALAIFSALEHGRPSTQEYLSCARWHPSSTLQVCSSTQQRLFSTLPYHFRVLEGCSIVSYAVVPAPVDHAPGLSQYRGYVRLVSDTIALVWCVKALCNRSPIKPSAPLLPLT